MLSAVRTTPVRAVMVLAAACVSAVAMPLASQAAGGAGESVVFVEEPLLASGGSANGTADGLDTGLTVRMVPAGGGPARTIAADTNRPRWSPDGSRLAYDVHNPRCDSTVSTTRRQATVVQVSSADGSNARTVTPCGFLLPVWSPDGTRLAVVDGNDIDVQDVDGSNRTTVYRYQPNPGRPLSMSFSPDGSRLAFVLEPTDVESGGEALWEVNTDGTGLRRLTTQEVYVYGLPAWSPDGEYISYASISDGGINVVRPDGSDDHFVAPGYHAAWSPDGRQLAVSIFPAGSPAGQPGQVQLFQPTDGGTGRPVYCTPSGAAAGRLAWLPDGSALVLQLVQSSNDGVQGTASDLYQIPIGGSAPTCGSTSAAVNNPTPIRLTSSGTATQPDLPRRVTRLAGATRVDTAISVSRATHASAGMIVVARDDLYPDALAAGPLAAKLGAPLLLSPPRATTAALRSEVRRLGATTAYLIGDTAALSAQVEQELRQSGVTTVTRIGGQTRFDTAALIAKRVGGSQVYVARGVGATAGTGWEDAAAVSGLASYQHRPILLTATDALPVATEHAIADLHASSGTIVGGTAAVSDSVAGQLRADGVSVDRVAGTDRYATSAAVADAAVAAGMGAGGPWLATGMNFPDALAAGPAVATINGVLLLVDAATLEHSPATRDWLTAHPGYDHVTAVGGPDVVSPTDTTQALQAGR